MKLLPNKRMKLTRPCRFKGSHLICAPGTIRARLVFRNPITNMNFMRLRWQHRLAAYARSVRPRIGNGSNCRFWSSRFGVPISMATWSIPAVILLLSSSVETVCACSPVGPFALVAMESDLGELALIQKSLWNASGRYSSDLPEFGVAGQPFQLTPGVSVEFLYGDRRGWMAKLGHIKTNITCTMGGGQYGLVGEGIVIDDFGQMVCDPLTSKFDVLISITLSVAILTMLVAPFIVLFFPWRRPGTRQFAIALFLLWPSLIIPSFDTCNDLLYLAPAFCGVVAICILEYIRRSNRVSTFAA